MHFVKLSFRFIQAQFKGYKEMLLQMAPFTLPPFVVLFLYILYLLILLVSLGCHNKLPQIEWLKQQKFAHSSGG